MHCGDDWPLDNRLTRAACKMLWDSPVRRELNGIVSAICIKSAKGCARIDLNEDRYNRTGSDRRRTRSQSSAQNCGAELFRWPQHFLLRPLRLTARGVGPRGLSRRCNLEF